LSHGEIPIARSVLMVVYAMGVGTELVCLASKANQSINGMWIVATEILPKW